MKKPLYDEAFKKKTVQYIKESGKAVAEVARELKITFQRYSDSRG